MRRYERAKFLERLCELRAIYALRGTDDRTSTMSIDDVATLVETTLEARSIEALSSQQQA